MTLADWGLKLRTPADRARAFVKVLDPRDVDQGNLKKIRWNGRVPDDLARQADANGILTGEAVKDYFQKQRNYLSLESTQMYVDATVEKAAFKVCQQVAKWHAEPVLVYLADSIGDGMNETPYAVVAGTAVADLAGQGSSIKPLHDDEIAVVDWPGATVRPASGATITLAYYAPDARNQLELKRTAFRVRELLPLEGALDDPDLTPEFPGITDQLDMANWDNPPFPYQPKRVKAVDESFWKRYRTTPRAYVSLETAQRLWGSRFGNLTSIRITPGVEGAGTEFGDLLLRELVPERGGFVLQKVKDLALRTGAGATDFGVLFLSFSFFLIVAALLLVGLLFRLNLDRRAGEMGVLTATGWSNSRVRWLLLAEGSTLAVLGGALGVAAARFYAELLLDYLRARWPSGDNLVFLRFHGEPSSYAIGYLSSLVVSILTIYWATRVLAKLTPRALLAGQTTTSSNLARKSLWGPAILVLASAGAAACILAGMFVEGHEAQAGSFFGSGACLLAAGLAALLLWLKRIGGHSSPQPRLGALGMRNAARHLVRSVLTAGLLAAATFLIVAVESFHKEAAGDFFRKEGGSGGFRLLAESAVPLFEDLNQPAVRDELNITLPFDGIKVYSCRVRAGDDASCLNLYQPLRPRVLGVSEDLVAHGGFAFSAGLWTGAEEKSNPWLLLEKPTADAIPAFADANTAQWILKVGLGDIVNVPGDNGEDVKLKIVGLLSESIFQSELVVADVNFRKAFPRQQGFQFFLIDAPAEKTQDIQNALQAALAGQGLMVSSTSERVQAYLAVENTYLATFQALGGLGLLLGAVGLAIVLLRSVWERRAELALLRALGFGRPALLWLVLAENLFLLMAGLAVGTVAALAAVAPHLTGAGAGQLCLRLALLLGLVVLVGLAAGVAAAIGTLRAPLLTALRRE